jgi:outer membrane protein TolC
MRIKTTIIIVAWLTWTVTPSISAQSIPVAQPAPPSGKKVFTLRDCLEKVKQENPAIRAIRFNLEAMDRRAKSIRALYLPQVTANGQAGYVTGESINYFSVLGVQDREVIARKISGLHSYESGGGQLYMPLIKDGSFFGINTPPSETIQQMNTEITRYSGEMTLQQILFNVTKTYLEVVTAKNKLDLLQHQKSLSEKQLSKVKVQLNYGLALQSDVSAAELAAVQNANAFEAASDLALSAFLRMAMMLDIKDPQSFAIEIAYPPMPKLPSYPMLMAMVGGDHPGIMKQEAVIKQAQAQLALDQNKIWPTVEYHGSYTYADDVSPPGHDGRDLWTSFVTVNVPVFDFGILHNQTRADLAALEAQNLQLQQTRDDLQQSLFDAYIAIRDNTYAAAAINSKVAAARTAFQKVEISQQLESASLSQVIDTEQNYLTLRLAQENVTSQHILSYAQLQSVVGGRWNWLDQPSAVSARISNSITNDAKIKTP